MRYRAAPRPVKKVENKYTRILRQLKNKDAGLILAF
jgi:hypothetical protein